MGLLGRVWKERYGISLCGVLPMKKIKQSKSESEELNTQPQGYEIKYGLP